MTRRELLGVAVVAVVAAAVGWRLCRRPDFNDKPERVMTFPGRTACPDHDSLQVWVGNDSGTVSALSLTSATTLIPEYHDCQRLITRNHTFGTLAGIWAAPYLQTIDDSLAGGHAAPVAIVHAWDGTYLPLGIQQKWNCLYFSRHPSGTGYAARMVKVQQESDCVGRIPSGNLPSGFDLDVQANQFDGLAPKDYPSVARWDRERGPAIQFIGVGCGAAWCEVYNPQIPHNSSQAFSPAPGSGQKQRRVLEVKGWYDEQYLAKATPSGLHPLPFLGAIWPDPELEDRKLPDFDGKWVPAGTTWLDDHSPDYKGKLNLRRGQPPKSSGGSDLTSFALCWQGPSGTSTCPGVPTDVVAKCAWNPAEDKDKMWYSMGTAGSEVKYLCVRRVAHATPVPGTARWSWLEHDETQWYRCAQGCCTLKP